MKRHIQFRPLSANNYQAKDDPLRLIADAAVPKMARAFAHALRYLRTTMPKQAIAERIRRGDYIGASNLVPLNRFQDGLHDPFRRIAATYQAGADLAAAWITRQFIRKDEAVAAPGDIFAFDLFTPEVVELLREYQAELITGLSAEVRAQVLDIIVNGVRLGYDAEQIATELEQVIGLSPAQVQAVRNLRRTLEGGDLGAALDRALLASKDVGAIRAAIAEGKSFLGGDVISAIIGRYADRALAYRAQMIAQTESVRAANLGLRDAYAQAVDRGVFPESALKVHWKIALDEKVCPICRPIPEMNPDGVGIREAFQTPKGPQAQPPMHPNCRCSIEVVTNLDLVASQAA
jgi:hypothetical protein